MSLTVLLAPVLGWLGVLSPELIGPVPWLSVFWSLLMLVLPSTLGIGALYFVVAVWTCKVAGPFVVATMLMLPMEKRTVRNRNYNSAQMA